MFRPTLRWNRGIYGECKIIFWNGVAILFFNVCGDAITKFLLTLILKTNKQSKTNKQKHTMLYHDHTHDDGDDDMIIMITSSWWWSQAYLHDDMITRGWHLYFRLDIILVKGLSKHTLNTYFSGMKINPKYAFLHAFFWICVSCPFQNLWIWPKTYPVFQFCTFLHP